MKNSRFTVANHILTFLMLPGDLMPDGLQSSEVIARSVNTNPRVIRRLVSVLQEAGLVDVYSGAHGGAKLTRDPEDITLLDVYRAVETEALFALHPHPPAQTCPVGLTITPVLTDVYRRVDAAIEGTLRDITIDDLYQEMRQAYLARQ